MSFYETIYDALLPKGDAPEETVLLLQSRAAGRRLLAALAANCGMLVGVRAETAYTLAAELCGPALSAPDAPRLMNDDESAELLLDCVRSASGTFTADSAGTLPAVRMLLRTLWELENEGVPPLTASKKQRDLQALRKAYAAAKKAAGLWDRTDLFAAAAAAAEKAGRPLRIVTLPTQRFSAAERALLGAAAGGKWETVPLAVPEAVPQAVSEGAPPAAPERVPLPGVDLTGLPAGDYFARRSPENTRIVPCMGAEVEVEQLFRDLLERSAKEDLALDSCAVVYADASYVPRLYEAAGRFGVPVSFSSGVPIEQTRTAAALRQLAEWERNAFDAERIRSLLAELGCLSSDKPYRNDDAALSAVGFKLGDALREYRVGWGEWKKYEQFLDRYESDARAKTDETVKQQLLARSAIWRQWLRDVFTLTVPEQADLEVQRAAMARFLGSCATAEAPERAALAKAKDATRRVRVLPAGLRLVDWLLQLLDGRSVMNGNAAPGRLFCLPLRQASLACRAHIYVLGLGHDAFVSDREDPVLLDSERQALMSAAPPDKPLHLTLSGDGGAEKRFRFCELLLHHAGDLTLSYPAYDVERDNKLLPTLLLQSLADRGCAAVEKAMRTYLAETPLTAADTLLRAERTELTGAPPYAGAGAADTSLSPVRSFAEVFKDFVFSASSMEQALKCPFNFYVRYILGIDKQTLPEWKANTWLEANVRGTYVHRVLECYYAALRDDPDMDAAAREAKLTSLMEKELALVAEKNPPAEQEVVDAEREKLEKMIRRAIDWTEAGGRTAVETEQNFGTAGCATPDIRMNAGSREFRFKGQIDRVDRCPGPDPGAPEHYSIVDYKTGDPEKQKQDTEYHLQHFLYRQAERVLSNGAIDPDEAGYLMLADDEAVFLTGGDEADRNAERAVEALLTAIENEDKCLEGRPWTVENGQLTPYDSGKTGQKKRVSDINDMCRTFCIYRDICPVLTAEQKGGKV